jgi:hypothetical protein
MAKRLKQNLRVPPGPGFSAKEPLFPSVASMDKDLGHTNQFILVNEVANRELNAQARDCPDGVESYVKSISGRHGIRVSLKDFNEVSNELPRSYTVLVFTAVDRTFRQLIKEIREYKQPTSWIDRVNDGPLSALEQLAENQPPGHKSIDSYPEYGVLQYYRLLRNEIVHPRQNRSRPTIAAHAAITASFGEYLRTSYQTRGAPNAPDKIDFDDFFLHTRVARDFAMVISDAYQLTIADILRVVSADKSLLERAKKAGNGSAESFRNFYYDYYFKRFQRWNDASAIQHASSFAKKALASFR